jgi:hypothetical protein
MKTEEIKELALTVIASLDLEELAQGCRRRLLIQDSQIEALKAERKALRKERVAFRAERVKLAALYQINMRVLNIVNAPAKAGEQVWQEKRNSNRSRTLDVLSKKTR